jgi:hypothetical protein
LYGCEVWYLTLREERVRMFQNRVLRRDEVTRGWKKLRHEELHSLYPSHNIRTIKSRRMRLAGHVACMGKMRNAYKISVGKAERKRPLRRRMRRVG